MMLEFSEKVIGQVSIPINITEAIVAEIIVGSFEGGSNYWMGINNDTKDFEDKPTDESLATWATKLLLEGKTLYFYDIEEENENWSLTLEKLIKGIKLNAINRPHDCDLENMDATTADCIIQFGLFGEVVFG